ncbi:MAG: fumarylacetoacetate hydrolase family protein [Holophagales bacterium]|nr:fumarylacetoacetate hydrolase family protein [Holophagales bacterium]MYF05855.1 fumarylacetoacetate hydrolase family protein [Holophagales bacterium]MYJ24718.1 fumarylacetoacetate hydrolase family protein [Holophagales bacterium]
MKLLSLLRDGRSAIGVLADDETVVDLSVAAPDLPRGMCRFLAGGDDAMDAARRAADSGAGRVPLADQTLLAPVPKPRKFFAIGLNYADHAAETGQQLPEFPTVFNKQVTCVNRPGGAIHIPRASSAVDYEGEFAFVIGRRCRGVAADDAAGVIAGYTIVNDVSVRDWQRRSPTMILGKGWDTHGPMGPYLVTADEVGDPNSLAIRTWVNDELRQDSNTRELVFDCPKLVETISTMCTLEPGDVVSTGTPAGVGLAFKPPKFLVAGDTVRIEIDGLGTLENPVIAEP